MGFNTLPLAVIEPGTAQLFVIHIKTEGFNKGELEACIGTEADNITRVRGDFWLEKNNIGHDFTVYQKRNFLFIDGTLTRPASPPFVGVDIGLVPDQTACKIAR